MGYFIYSIFVNFFQKILYYICTMRVKSYIFNIFYLWTIYSINFVWIIFIYNFNQKIIMKFMNCHIIYFRFDFVENFIPNIYRGLFIYILNYYTSKIIFFSETNKWIFYYLFLDEKLRNVILIWQCTDLYYWHIHLGLIKYWIIWIGLIRHFLIFVYKLIS